jgi:flavorubredoxin
MRKPNHRMASYAGRRFRIQYGKADTMKAIVVYESHWGNTAAVAQAIAEGIGYGAKALSTAEASAAAIAGAELVVAGAPIIAFSLPTETQLERLGANTVRTGNAPDVSHPTMRSWLKQLQPAKGRFAAFETRLWWSLGGATGGIEHGLARAGYRPAGKPRRFIVQGTYGPLRDGELEKAKAWGAQLAQAVR